MDYENRLKQIRESEKQSHIEMYSNSELYKEGSWLRKPIKTVFDIIPLFKNYSELNVLDLGCGVGRNCVAIAQSFKNIPCKIDCVDILDLAIEKLYENAEDQGIATSINGIVETIENYPVGENKYDLVIAVSALEHIDSEQSFISKLSEINRGIRKNGVVCLVINSDVKETDKSTGKEIPAQFEVNLQTEKLQAVLKEKFSDGEIARLQSKEISNYIKMVDFNEEGKAKAIEYIDLLKKSGMYEPEPIKQPTIIPFRRNIRLFDIPASAGTGSFLDSEDFTMLEVGEEVPADADFGIRISGDSMEPQFINGQIVWIHQQETLSDGEIGIFFLDGDAYCKKLKDDTDGLFLISLNKKYDPIPIKEETNFKVFGKVVG